MIFFLFAAVIALLVMIVNLQMEAHFSEYVYTEADGLTVAVKGIDEEAYIASVHKFLFWIGFVMVILGSTVSYFVIRHLTRPVSELTAAVRELQEGHLGKTVPVRRHDEIGVLAAAFNDMSLRLYENDQQRRRLFAGMAHELRTPMAILQGNLEGMLDDVVPLDKETVLSLEDEVVRMRRLVQDLRDLSLAENHELLLHKEETDMNNLLSRAVNMLQPMLDEKRLRIEVHLAADLPPVNVDADRFNQVVYNLLNNAVRYTETGKTISVTTALNNQNYLVLTIADEGKGIAETDLPHIFEYFYRGEKSRNRGSGGSGIGLALAKQYVLCHDGTIDVASRVSEGTTVTVRIPIGES